MPRADAYAQTLQSAATQVTCTTKYAYCCTRGMNCKYENAKRILVQSMFYQINLSVLVKRLTRKSISEMIYFVSSGITGMYTRTHQEMR